MPFGRRPNGIFHFQARLSRVSRLLLAVSWPPRDTSVSHSSCNPADDAMCKPFHAWHAQCVIAATGSRVLPHIDRAEVLHVECAPSTPSPASTQPSIASRCCSPRWRPPLRRSHIARLADCWNHWPRSERVMAVCPAVGIRARHHCLLLPCRAGRDDATITGAAGRSTAIAGGARLHAQFPRRTDHVFNEADRSGCRIDSARHVGG